MNLKVRTGRFSPIVFLVLALITDKPGFAQQQEIENSVFWEVTGNGLSKPSYLFGTFHLMGNLYVDSLSNVVDKLNKSEVIVGELLIDSSMTSKVLAASMLKETTLDQLLNAYTYQQAADWLKAVSGYDLKLFNRMNPITIQIFLMTMTQQKYYPMDPAKDIPMDVYFQQHGKKNNKKVIGLETVEDQLQALYGQFSLERQAQLLEEYVAGKEKAYDEMISMNRFYRLGNLGELEKLMATQSYESNETAILLDNRNKKWMEQIPGLLREKCTFIAVGALHLSGKNGLVNLLRQQGFTVKPLNLK